MEGVSDVLHIRVVESSDRDSSVVGQIDLVVVDELLAGVLVNSGEGEHPDLVGEVVPVVSAS